MFGMKSELGVKRTPSVCRWKLVERQVHLGAKSKQLGDRRRGEGGRLGLLQRQASPMQASRVDVGC